MNSQGSVAPFFGRMQGRRKSFGGTKKTLFGRKNRGRLQRRSSIAASLGIKNVEKLSESELNKLIHIANFLGRKNSEELTRSELDKLLLDKVGVHVSETIMAEIFRDCDADNSGSVSIEEFASFLNGIKPRVGFWEKIFYVLSKVLLSVTWWSALMFLTSIVVSMTLNIYARRGGLPRDDFNYYGMNSILFIIGCYVFVALVYDRIMTELQLMELVNTKIVQWAKTVNLRDFDTSKDMTPHQFFSLLERQGIYLPYKIFKKVFDRIDDDGSGTLSLAEIKLYADGEVARGELTRVQFHAKVLRKCFLSLDYWLNWGWVVASLLFAVAAFGENLSDNVRKHLNGSSCALFLACAVFQYIILYKSNAAFLDRTEELNDSLVQMVKNQSRKASDLRLSSMGSEPSKRHVDAEAEKDANIQEACHQIFETFDVRGEDGGGDGNLDFLELYDALTHAGVVIQLEVLRYIFNQADVNGDGTLQAEEFVKYIFSVKRDKSPFERRKGIIIAMLKTVACWTTFLQVMGGVIIVIISYADASAQTLRNWGLAGNVCWMLPSLYYLTTTARNHAIYLESVARSKNKLKQSFLSAMDVTEHVTSFGSGGDDGSQEWDVENQGGKTRYVPEENRADALVSNPRTILVGEICPDSHGKVTIEEGSKV